MKRISFKDVLRAMGYLMTIAMVIVAAWFLIKKDPNVGLEYLWIDKAYIGATFGTIYYASKGILKIPRRTKWDLVDSLINAITTLAGVWIIAHMLRVVHPPAIVVIVIGVLLTDYIYMEEGKK